MNPGALVIQKNGTSQGRGLHPQMEKLRSVLVLSLYDVLVSVWVYSGYSVCSISICVTTKDCVSVKNVTKSIRSK